MSIGFWQIAIVVILVVLLFGRGKISSLMGDVAKGIKSFKKGMSTDVTEEDSQKNISENQELALPSSPLDERFTFDRFVVGKPNELAHAAAKRVSDGGKVTFNPLFLYGGVGLGKTHLMHSIAWSIKQKNKNNKRRVNMGIS